MIPEMMSSEIERQIRRMEVLAVVRALRSGRTPHIGEGFEYFIDYPSKEHPGAFAHPRKTLKPYRFEMEQWHLDAAREALANAASAP